ncbi:MAG: PorP/SprF family type IX secretion system membrane protein [Lewinellaceae bacterium]|nr:PorP/SprF family type IX secretion system membrane protein [Lewinellaceae bacterium]
MKKLLTPILLCSGLFALQAQQAPQYSMYQLNPYAYNPACAGLENTLVATGVYRQQWSGLRGAPETRHINVHLPLYMIRSGVGFRVENDVIGAHQTTQGVLTYNLQWEFGRNNRLSIGASAGYLQYLLDGAKLRAPEGSYEPSGVFLHNDPLLPEGKITAGTVVAEVGIHFQRNNLAIGVATQPVFAPVLESSGAGTFRLKPVRHFLGTVSYQIDLGRNLSIKPSFLLKSDITLTQVELSNIIRWRENTFAGISYRGMPSSSQDAFIILGGVRLNEKISLAYSFDIPLSALAVTNRGSHELLLRYELNRPIGVGKLPPVIYNPRFFKITVGLWYPAMPKKTQDVEGRTTRLL